MYRYRHLGPPVWLSKRQGLVLKERPWHMQSVFWCNPRQACLLTIWFTPCRDPAADMNPASTLSANIEPKDPAADPPWLCAVAC